MKQMGRGGSWPGWCFSGSEESGGKACCLLLSDARAAFTTEARTGGWSTLTLVSQGGMDQLTMGTNHCRREGEPKSA